MSLFVCIFSSSKIITIQTVFRKVLFLYIKYIVPNDGAFSALFSIIVCSCILKRCVFLFWIYETLSTSQLVKYKSYSKRFFEEIKTLTQQRCSKVGITWRLNLFSLSSPIIEWSVLCSWMSPECHCRFSIPNLPTIFLDKKIVVWYTNIHTYMYNTYILL